MNEVTLQAAAFAAERSRFNTILWLMPAAFALHICEEGFGGFTRYVVEDMHGSRMPGPLFLLNNTVFMAILVGLSIWATRSQSPRSAFLLMAWASGNLFWDFLVHLGYTVATGHFSPGLVTATLLYYPLTFWVSAVALREGRLSLNGLVGAFGVGAVLMLLVLWGGVYHFRTG
jgi:hypothetical protein